MLNVSMPFHLDIPTFFLVSIPSQQHSGNLWGLLTQLPELPNKFMQVTTYGIKSASTLVDMLLQNDGHMFFETDVLSLPFELPVELWSYKFICLRSPFQLSLHHYNISTHKGLRLSWRDDFRFLGDYRCIFQLFPGTPTDNMVSSRAMFIAWVNSVLVSNKTLLLSFLLEISA